MIVIAAQHHKVGVRRLDGEDHAAQVGHGVDGVFNPHDIAAGVHKGFDKLRSQILPGQRREVIEDHRQGHAVSHLLEVADQVRFRHFPVVGINHHDAVCTDLLRVLAQFNGLPGVGAPGADQHRYPAIHMGDSKFCDGFAFFGVELRKLPAAAQKEQAIYTGVDHAVD